MITFEDYIISEELNIKDALSVMEYLGKASIENEKIILYTTNSNGQLTGSLSDGDIRRSLIAKQNLKTKLYNICNKKVKYIKNINLSSVKKIKKLREGKFPSLPILNYNNKIEDIIKLESTKNILPISAVIIAGGKGTRLYPITENIPKCLVKVNGITILDRTLSLLNSYGIKDINIITHHLSEKIERHIKDKNINILKEQKPMGTIGGVSLVKNIAEKNLFIINSDIITDIKLDDLYIHHKKMKSEFTIACKEYGHNVPFGVFEKNKKNITLIEKPTYNYTVNSGIYIINGPSYLSLLDNEKTDVTDLIHNALTKKNFDINLYENKFNWTDIGNIKDLEIARNNEKL